MNLALRVCLYVTHVPTHLTSYNLHVTQGSYIISCFLIRDANTCFRRACPSTVDLLHPSVEEDVCLCVRRADGQCTLSGVVICITCRSVTRVCHRAWEPKRSHVNPPSGLPISLSGRHLPHQRPTAAWRSFSLRTLGEREVEEVERWRKRGRLLQIWLRQALGGEVGLLWPLLQPQPAVWVWDNRGCGTGVWWVVLFCMCLCASVCVSHNACMSFGWSH